MRSRRHDVNRPCKANILGDLGAQRSDSRRRLDDLADRYREEPGHLREWLDHDRGQVQARIGWLEGLRDQG